MISEAIDILSGWGSLDTWIVITAAIAAMACALPGNFLLVRRQSMIGDALSHTTLPGVVLAFLAAHALRTAGWVSAETYHGWLHAVMFGGALLLGIFSAMLTEWVQLLGRVDRSASLGVVFTTLFAVGLVLVRAVADRVHLDPDCVLYGTLETVVMDTWAGTNVPKAAIGNGVVLMLNLALVRVFYKELVVSAFDPALGTTLGIHSRAMHYGLVAITAATLVTAFESVGSILVIAMLIAPAATAYLLTDRLSVMIALSLLIAALSALLGHVMAITLPPIIFHRLGFPTVVDASTAGTMALACGLLFLVAWLLAPRYGVLSKAIGRIALSMQIVAEDVLGAMYRIEETKPPSDGLGHAAGLRVASGTGRVISWLAIRRLAFAGQIRAGAAGYELTPQGRLSAIQLVRSHRLWESYMDKHFEIPADHLHETAAQVEHFIGPALREELAGELDTPIRDPHGKAIPPESMDQDNSADQR